MLRIVIVYTITHKYNKQQISYIYNTCSILQTHIFVTHTHSHPYILFVVVNKTLDHFIIIFHSLTFCLIFIYVYNFNSLEPRWRPFNYFLIMLLQE